MITKFYCQFEDWGIYSVREVEVLEAGIEDQRFPRQKLARVRPAGADQGWRGFLVSESLLFGSWEEAKRYGSENYGGAF